MSLLLSYSVCSSSVLFCILTWFFLIFHIYLLLLRLTYVYYSYIYLYTFYSYFLVFWVWQILWVYIVSLSLIFINGNANDASNVSLNYYDYIGWFIFIIGFILQTISDFIKFNFRSKIDNKNKICMIGPWKWSRHPNFCGEVLMWWGLFIAAIPIITSSNSKLSYGWFIIISPLFTMLVLLLFSGIPQAEGSNSVRWYDGGEKEFMYETYFNTTPPLWIFPPFLYQKLPNFIKLFLCFELPMYKYHPTETNQVGTTEGLNNQGLA